MTTSNSASAADLAGHIEAASERIAPTWPLDQFIAVNPYWGWRASTAPHAAASLAALAGTSLTMPREWFRQEWLNARLSTTQLTAAAAALGDDGDMLVEAALAGLNGQAAAATPIRRMALVTDVRDLDSAPRPGQSWTELVTHQLGQHCAAHFDRWQGSWHPDQTVDLFTGWRDQHSAFHGVRWQHGASWARTRISSLPADPDAAIAAMLADLAIPQEGSEAYLTALLLSVNGWSAWCAYRRWQARLAGDDDNEIVALLAVRLAWEWLLRADAGTPPDLVWAAWADSWAAVTDVVADIAREQQLDWLLQTAVERTYQNNLIVELNAAPAVTPDAPVAQAVFCIDVRSEVFRRALEAAAPAVHTRGFAGFFGLPISYRPTGGELVRPQLPGLLAPAIEVGEELDGGSADPSAVTIGRQARLADRRRWSTLRSAPASVFSFVETMGLLYGPKLVKDSLAHTEPPTPWEHDGLTAEVTSRLRPRLGLVDDDPAAAASIAERILRAMGLVDGFAPIVLLCGHGSRSANNPHAAGLDCGACGGQTGEVNARVLADLLNSTEVRARLRTSGIDVPTTTWFVPALHNTTTDEVELFDTHLAPAGTRAELGRLCHWLEEAGDRARAERAESLGLGSLGNRPEQLRRTILERSNDWSQVRPEWGLAGNAAFVVAPRRRTRHVDLAGRCFLHDYDWQLDPDLSVLTLIMTAPMVVTNWINMQYHASTVDNRRYGSGNKVLHNVVGGRIGVFEGNGGDLRIGLAMQSLHDGEALRHPPLRLSVFIEAPRHGIDSVIDAHAVVSDLVLNGWIHLLRIDPPTGLVERRTPEGWVPA